MKKILIISGMHGDEPSGPYAVFKFLEFFHNSPSLRKKFKIDALPLINPTGFLKGTRANQEGKDINRFFTDRPKKDEPEEAKILKKFAHRLKKPYDFLVSLHEDPKRKEFYLYDTGIGREAVVIKKIFKVIKTKKLPLYTGWDTDNLKSPALNYITNGYVAIPKKDQSPTIEEYFSRHDCAKRVITLEIPGKLPLGRKIKLGLSLLKTIIKNI